MITYEELLDLALIQTGQFILDQNDLELQKPRLEMMIQRELAWYSKYLPIKKTADMKLWDKKVFSVEEDGVIPINIINIRRLDRNIYPMFMQSRGRYVNSVRWKYFREIGELEFFGPTGIYRVDYYEPHVYENEMIKTLDSHSPFVNLFIAQLMISLGRGRGAFTLNDIPITTNADSLVSEGQELLQSTREFIQETSAYNLAVRY